MKTEIQNTLKAIESQKLELEGLLNDAIEKMVRPGCDVPLGTPVRVVNAGAWVRDDIPALFAAVSIGNIEGQLVLENEAGDRLNTEELGVDCLTALADVLMERLPEVREMSAIGKMLFDQANATNQALAEAYRQ